MIATILQLWWVTNQRRLGQTLAPQVQDQRDLEGDGWAGGALVLNGWPLLTGPANSAVAGAGAGGPDSASVPNLVRTPVGIPSSP